MASITQTENAAQYVTDGAIKLAEQLASLEVTIDRHLQQYAELKTQRDDLLAALKEARSELELTFHKFERAGGIWAVAERGVPLGAHSWASNVENSLNNTRAILDAAMAKAEGH